MKAKLFTLLILSFISSCCRLGDTVVFTKKND